MGPMGLPDPCCEVRPIVRPEHGRTPSAGGSDGARAVPGENTPIHLIVRVSDFRPESGSKSQGAIPRARSRTPTIISPHAGARPQDGRTITTPHRAAAPAGGPTPPSWTLHPDSPRGHVMRLPVRLRRTLRIERLED